MEAGAQEPGIEPRTAASTSSAADHQAPARSTDFISCHTYLYLLPYATSILYIHSVYLLPYATFVGLYTKHVTPPSQPQLPRLRLYRNSIIFLMGRAFVKASVI
jgi:hypothetical protein